jgi:hypothetical protein
LCGKAYSFNCVVGHLSHLSFPALQTLPTRQQGTKRRVFADERRRQIRAGWLQAPLVRTHTLSESTRSQRESPPVGRSRQGRQAETWQQCNVATCIMPDGRLGEGLLVHGRMPLCPPDTVPTARESHVGRSGVCWRTRYHRVDDTVYCEREIVGLTRLGRMACVIISNVSYINNLLLSIHYHTMERFLCHHHMPSCSNVQHLQQCQQPTSAPFYRRQRDNSDDASSPTCCSMAS